MNLCPVTMDVHEKARLPHEETKETKEKEGNDYEIQQLKTKQMC